MLCTKVYKNFEFKICVVDVHGHWTGGIVRLCRIIGAGTNVLE